MMDKQEDKSPTIKDLRNPFYEKCKYCGEKHDIRVSCPAYIKHSDAIRITQKRKYHQKTWLEVAGMG